MISFLYSEIFFRPVTNALVWLTGIIPGGNLGLAVVLLTIFVRFVLFPFSHRMILTQIAMRKIEPELKKIKEQHKDKREDQAQAMMKLYKEHGISPFSGIIFLIIQLPLLIAMYQLFLRDFTFETLGPALYSFVSFPEVFSLHFLGVLVSEPSAVFAALAGISQFFQVRFSLVRTPDKPVKNSEKTFGSEFQRAMKTQMQYVFPFIIFFIGLQFSAALTIYWTVMNIFAIVHEALVHHRGKKVYDQGATTTNIAA